MSAATWVLVWVGVASATPAEQRALQDYAETRLIHLSPPTEPRAPRGAVSEPSAAAVERALEEARVLSSLLKHAAALEELERARALLLATPSLPQAPWLLAECLRLTALVRAQEPAGAELAQALWREATWLDGGRAPAAGERIELGPAATPRTVLLSYDGPDQVFINGHLSSPPHHAQLGEGPLHVRIAHDGLELSSAWLTIPAGTTRLALPSQRTPCEARAFAALRKRPDHPAEAASISCPRWVMARPAPGPGASGAVQLKACEGSWCGGWVRWRASSRRWYAPSVEPSSAAGWPAWATYVLVGVGLVATTSFALWHAGAFDTPAPGSRGWVYQPPTSLSF